LTAFRKEEDAKNSFET